MQPRAAAHGAASAGPKHAGNRWAVCRAYMMRQANAQRGRAMQESCQDSCMLVPQPGATGLRAVQRPGGVPPRSASCWHSTTGPPLLAPPSPAVLRRALRAPPASVALELQRVGTDAVLGDNQDLHVIALQACGTREGWVGRQSRWWHKRTVERAPPHKNRRRPGLLELQ